MKRINNIWWHGDDGYYKQMGKGIFQGPYESMEEEIVGEDSTVIRRPIDSGFITVSPVIRPNISDDDE